MSSACFSISDVREGGERAGLNDRTVQLGAANLICDYKLSCALNLYYFSIQIDS